MLALLNITSGYYVQLILNGLKDAAGLRLEAYVIRICVALKASGREQLPSVSEIGGHPRGREVLELVKKLWNDLDMPMEEYQDTVLPLGVSVQLLRYSRGCCEKLRRDQAMRSGDRKRLLDLYRMNFSSFEDFQTMQEEIITYRREVLSPYDQAGAAPL